MRLPVIRSDVPMCHTCEKKRVCSTVTLCQSHCWRLFIPCCRSPRFYCWCKHRWMTAMPTRMINVAPSASDALLLFHLHMFSQRMWLDRERARIVDHLWWGSVYAIIQQSWTRLQFQAGLFWSRDRASVFCKQYLYAQKDHFKGASRKTTFSSTIRHDFNHW